MIQHNNIPAILGHERRVYVKLIPILFVFLLLFAVSDWPGEVALNLWKLLTEGRCPTLRSMGDCVYLHEDVWASTKRVIPAVVGALAAIVIAFFGSLSTTFGLLLRWFVVIFYAVPSTAIYLFLINWIGFGEETKLWGMAVVGISTELLFSMSAVWGFLYGKGSDVEQWEPLYRQMQLAGVGRLRLVWEHMIPLLSQQHFWSLIIVVGFAWKMIIIIEAIGATGTGLGYMMFQSIHIGGDEGTLQLLSGITATAVCSGLTIWAIYALARLHERRIFRFRR